MSTASEESPTNNSLEALEALYAPPRRPVERSEPRLAAVSETPFARPAKLDVARAMTPQGDRLETAMAEFVRRQLQPEVVPEPKDLKRDTARRMVMASAIGVVAAVAIVSVVALLFFTLFPKERDAVQSFAAALPPATSLLHQADEASSQGRTLVATDNRGEGFTHEQSERLLQQFVQWRQKTALIDKP